MNEAIQGGMDTELPVNEMIEAVTAKIYQQEPSLLERFGERGKEKCKEDNHHHFNHLKTAYELNDTTVFADYAVWLNGILTKHGMKTKHLLDNFQIIETVLSEFEPKAPGVVSFYKSAIQAGKDALSDYQ